MCWPQCFSLRKGYHNHALQDDCERIPCWNLHFKQAAAGYSGCSLVNSYWSISPPTAVPTHALWHTASKKDAGDAPYHLAWTSAGGSRIIDVCSATYSSSRDGYYVFSMPSPPFAASSPVHMNVVRNPSAEERWCAPWQEHAGAALKLTLRPRPCDKKRYWISVSAPGMRIHALVTPHCVSDPDTWCVARLVLELPEAHLTGI